MTTEEQHDELARRVGAVVADLAAAILARYDNDVERATAMLTSVIRNNA